MKYTRFASGRRRARDDYISRSQPIYIADDDLLVAGGDTIILERHIVCVFVLAFYNSGNNEKNKEWDR